MREGQIDRETLRPRRDRDIQTHRDRERNAGTVTTAQTSRQFQSLWYRQTDRHSTYSHALALPTKKDVALNEGNVANSSLDVKDDKNATEDDHKSIRNLRA